MTTSGKTDKTTKRPSAQSKNEAEFELQLKAVKAPAWERELRFHRPRRFRFDFAFIEVMFAVEIEGITYGGGRHQRKDGFEKDLEKYQIAMIDGWTFYRCSPAQVKSGRAIQVTLQMLGMLDDERNNRPRIWRDNVDDAGKSELARNRVGKGNGDESTRKPAKKRGKNDSGNRGKKENEHQASSLKPAIMPSAIVTKLVDTARMARTQRDLAQVLYDESVDALKEHIGDAVGIDQLVAWFGVERTVVDAKKLKADHPEVYQKVAYQQKRRPFRLLDIGADE